jgi:hypothetical protein
MLKDGPAYIVYISKARSYFGPIGLGLGLYALGVIMNAENLGAFFKEQLFPLVILDIVWVTAGIVWAYRRHRRIYDEAEQLFHFKSETRSAEPYRRALYRDKAILCWSIPAIMFIDSVILLIHIHLLPVPFDLYSEVFSTDMSVTYFLILGTLVGYITGLGVYLMWKHTRFIGALSREKLSLDALLDRLLAQGTRRVEELKDLVGSTFVAIIVMSVGVADIALAASPVGHFEDVGVFAFLAATVVMTFYFSLRPIYYLHDAIEDAKVRMREDVRLRFDEEWGTIGPDMPISHRVLLLDALEHVERLEAWPIEYVYVAIEVLAPLLPFAIYLIPH